MGRTLVYPKTKRNTIHRMPQRGTYDLREIQDIINGTSVLHVSFNSTDANDPFPTIIPMIGTMGSFEFPSADTGEPLDCYLHGYVSSGIMKQARSDHEEGLPVTIAATQVDGIVLSLTPNSHSYNYRSAVLFGHGKLVEDNDEKLWAMRLVTNSVVPDRWEQTRTPPDAGEMASTVILKVSIVDGSGKTRTGGPGDEKKDCEREEVVESVYTCVLPTYVVVGEPIVSGAGKLAIEPENVSEFRRQVNESNKSYALRAAESVLGTVK